MENRIIKFRAWNGGKMIFSDNPKITFSFDKIGWIVGSTEMVKKVVTKQGVGEKEAVFVQI